MTTTAGSRDLAEEWLTAGSVLTEPAPGTPRAYPKRSELRRAEARAAARRGADRRPTGSRPPGASSGRQRPPAPSTSARGAELGRRPSPYAAPAPRLPLAVAPTPAVLPIRQTATQVRPAGIDLPIQPSPSPDAFHRPLPIDTPLVPLAVPVLPDETPEPAPDGALAPPQAPAELAAPVTPALDPAVWGLDIEAAPASGRRRGEDDARPQTRRPQTSVPAKLFGRGKARAARLLVLALVVGAEGVAVTSMTGHSRQAPVEPTAASGVYELTALSPAAIPAASILEDSADRQRSAMDTQAEALVVAEAHESSSKAKVNSALKQAKAAADRVKAAAERRERAMRDARRNPKGVARLMTADRGWGASQFSCLESLWTRESGWNYQATNPSSGAYGIPQSLPASKMASAGADYRTNPVTQIRWGLDYIAQRYGTPCGAWAHSESVGWY